MIDKYLADETARCRIVESAHSFVTRELTLERSVRRVLTSPPSGIRRNAPAR